MHVVALIGSPVAHSLSPAMHEAAFATAGLDWRFVSFDVPAGRAEAALAAAAELGLAGLAVTTPHKEQVAASVDELDESAAELRSVNTVVFGEPGTIGSSTDGDGFVAGLREAGWDPTGRRIAVLGAGAASRSVIAALGRHGAASIAVVNRSADRAEVAAALTDVAGVGAIDDVTTADIVVNATSVGMGGSREVPLPDGVLRAGQVVADLVYHPLDTALLQMARSAGCHTVDGLSMLVHQGVLQQQRWTGQRPDPSTMRAAAEAALRFGLTPLRSVRPS